MALFGGYADLILQRRRLVLLLITSVTLLLGYYATRLKIDTSVEGLFQKRDRDLLLFQEFQKHFGTDETILIAYYNQDLLTNGSLEVIRSLTQRIQGLSGVGSVISLTNLVRFKREGEEIVVRPLVGPLPVSRADLALLRSPEEHLPFYVKHLISKDRSATVLLVTLKASASPSHKERMALIGEIRRILKDFEIPEGSRFYLAGVPVIKTTYEEFLNQELAIFSPLMVLVLAGILWFFFRSFKLTLLTLIPLMVALIWTIGLFTLLNRSISTVTSMIPPLVLAVTVTVDIYFVIHLIRLSASQPDRRILVREVLELVGPPCFLSSLTTAIGFGSLSINQIVPIREFGLFSAFGILSAFFLSFTIIPIGVAGMGTVRSGALARTGASPFSMWPSLAGFALRRRWWIVAAAASICIGASAAVSGLRVDTDILEFFDKRTELRKAYLFLSRKFPGSTTIELMIRSHEKPLAKDPSFLMRMAELQSELLKIDHIKGVLSSISYLQELDRVIRRGGQESESLFRRKGYISQLLFLFAMGDNREWYQYASKDGKTLRLTLFLEALSTKKMESIFARIEQKLDRRFPPHVEADIVGTTKLYVNMNRYLLTGQIESLTMAFTTIGILMIILFRSLRIALISMIPNVIPIFLTLAIMSLSGIPLDISTVVIGPIAMGIVVDDTIHFIFCYLRFRRQGISAHDSLKKTLSTVGSPITLTSITLGLCFGILAFSHFLPIIYFGKLTALTMGFAWVAVLILLPALLSITEK